MYLFSRQLVDFPDWWANRSLRLVAERAACGISKEYSNARTLGVAEPNNRRRLLGRGTVKGLELPH